MFLRGLCSKCVCVCACAMELLGHSNVMALVNAVHSSRTPTLCDCPKVCHPRGLQRYATTGRFVILQDSNFMLLPKGSSSSRIPTLCYCPKLHHPRGLQRYATTESFVILEDSSVMLLQIIAECLVCLRWLDGRGRAFSYLWSLVMSQTMVEICSCHMRPSEQ